jgi:hypothetical protein
VERLAGEDQILRKKWRDSIHIAAILGDTLSLRLSPIPDRHAGSSEKKSAPPRSPNRLSIPPLGWRRRQEKNIDPKPDPGLAQEEDEPGLTELETTPPLSQENGNPCMHTIASKEPKKDRILSNFTKTPV